MYIHYCTGVISLLYFWIQSSCKYHNTCIDMGANEGLPYGLVVRIPGFHPGGPGSIPGVGTIFYPLVQALCKHESLRHRISYSKICFCVDYWTMCVENITAAEIAQLGER